MFGFLTRGPGNTGYVQFDNDARPRTAAFKEVWRHGLRAVNNLWPGNYQRLPEAVGFEMSDLSNTPLKELAKAFKDAFVDLQPQTELTDVQIGLIKGLANLNTAELIEISDHMGGQAQFKEKIFSLMSINQHGSNPDIQSCLARLQHPEIELEHPIIDLKDAAPPLPNSDGPLVKHGGLGMTFGGLNTPVVDVNAMVESRGGETVTVYSTTADQLLKDVQGPDKVRQYLSGLPGYTKLHIMPLSNEVRVYIGDLNKPTGKFILSGPVFDQIASIGSGKPATLPPPPNNTNSRTLEQGGTTTSFIPTPWEPISGVGKHLLVNEIERLKSPGVNETQAVVRSESDLKSKSRQLHQRTLETAAIISRATARVIKGEKTDIFKFPEGGAWGVNGQNPREEIAAVLDQLVTSHGLEEVNLTQAQTRHLQHATNFLKCLQNCGSDTTFLTLSRTILAHIDQVIDTKVSNPLTIENVKEESTAVYDAISGKGDYALSIRPEGRSKETAMYTILYGGQTEASEPDQANDFGETDSKDGYPDSNRIHPYTEDESESQTIPTNKYMAWLNGPSVNPDNAAIVPRGSADAVGKNGGKQEFTMTIEELREFFARKKLNLSRAITQVVGQIPPGTVLTFERIPDGHIVSWGNTTQYRFTSEALAWLFDNLGIEGSAPPTSSKKPPMLAIEDAEPNPKTIENTPRPMPLYQNIPLEEDDDTDLNPQIIVGTRVANFMTAASVTRVDHIDEPQAQLLGLETFMGMLTTYLAVDSCQEGSDPDRMNVVLAAVPQDETPRELEGWVANTNEGIVRADFKLDADAIRTANSYGTDALYFREIRIEQPVHVVPNVWSVLLEALALIDRRLNSQGEQKTSENSVEIRSIKNLVSQLNHPSQSGNTNAEVLDEILQDYEALLKTIGTSSENIKTAVQARLNLHGTEQGSSIEHFEKAIFRKPEDNKPKGSSSSWFSW